MGKAIKVCLAGFSVLLVSYYQAAAASTSVAVSSNTCLTADIASNPHHQQVLIPGGTFTMGSDTGQRHQTVDDFRIDAHEVTNAQFRRFVEATGYVTSAEHKPDPALYPGITAALLVPGSASFIKLSDRPKGQWRQWLKFIAGASWQHPAGPDSNITGLDNLPVVHVSHRDAQAYADWAGRALPTEAQWEYAARASAAVKQANTWQGFFPLQDKALDGYAGVAPVGCYPADASGLFDMKGNVWEMVSDIFDVTAESRASVAPMRVIKGGSFLCADNYCEGDRPQARQGQEEDFSSDHVGFRTVSKARSTLIKTALRRQSQELSGQFARD